MVEVRTDLRCDEVADTAVVTGTVDNVETRDATATSTTCADGRIGMLVVAPAEDDQAELAVRVVTGLKGKRAEDCKKDAYDRCIVSRRAVRYGPHRSVRMNVMMRASCINAPCDAAGFTTCVQGSCVPARVDPDVCGDGVCEESGLVGPKTDATCGPVALPPGVSGRGWLRIAPLGSAAVAPRSGHTAVWTCSEMIVWGGGPNIIAANGIDDQGAAYTPKTGLWRKLPVAPIPRRALHAALWTGKEMFVWGGLAVTAGGSVFAADGALYEPTSDRWTTIPTEPTLRGRIQFTTVHAPTTNEVIVWGGFADTETLGDGGAFSLTTRSWRKLAPPPAAFAPRRSAAGVFIDGKVVIVGGSATGQPTSSNDGASYDPVTDTWALLPPSNLPPAVIGAIASKRGGRSIGLIFGKTPTDGAYFDGARWTPIPALLPTTVASNERNGAVAWSTGTELYFWGGKTAGTEVFQGDGAVFDFDKSAWSKMPDSIVLAPRQSAAAVWTGSYAIVVGGASASAPFDDAAVFVP